MEQQRIACERLQATAMLQLLEELFDPKRDGTPRAIVLAQELGREPLSANAAGDMEG